jgi:PIN domain nuclease of toxin-antitoxin system
VRGFLLDTHVWLWHLRGDEVLSQEARKLIDGAVEDCWLSPISVWETGILQDRGKIRLKGDYRSWFEESQRSLPLRTAPLSSEVAMVSLEIELPHRDPADRFIAATSKVYDLTLITADRRLLDCTEIETLAARG